MSATDTAAAEATARRELTREQLAAGRSVSVRPRGHSMWPTIRCGSELTVEPYLTGDEPRVGDVVLVPREAITGRDDALPGEPLVLHRVVRLIAGMATLQGDSRPAPDGVVSVDDLWGRLPRARRDPAVARTSKMGGATKAALMRRARAFFDRPLGRS